MHRWLFWKLVALLVVCAPAVVYAQADDDDEDNPFRPGLIAEYQQDGASATRVEPTISVAWLDAPPDPRFSSGPLHVSWSGRLLTQGPGAYRLHAYGIGEVQIELAGKTVLQGKLDDLAWLSTDVLNIEHDYHPLVVTYHAQGREKRLRLFWSSESTPLEPLPAKQLYHAQDAPQLLVDGAFQRRSAGVQQLTRHWPRGDFDRGRDIARAARCAGCHTIPGEAEPLPAPALDNLAGNMNAAWLRWWLVTSADKSAAQLASRAAQHPVALQLDAHDAAALAQLLLNEDEAPAKQEAAEALAGDAARGAHVFQTVGCFACHQVNGQGTSGLFSGGDLSHIADKRPPSFFAKWLASPIELNREHRMPVFELTAAERDDVAAYLSTLKSDAPPHPPEVDLARATRERGVEVANHFGCANCHRMAPGVDARERTPIRADCDIPWRCDQNALVRAQSGPPHRIAEYYGRSAADQADLAEYIAAVARRPAQTPVALDGPQLMRERSCTACHSRENAAGLAPRLVSLAAAHPDLAPLVPALTPPSLIAVGDKLHDPVLLAQIKRMEEPLREYLQVRMPRFRFTQAELEALLAHFVAYDRIPPLPPDDRVRPPKNLPQASELLKAGERLVVAGAGFGCTSCHAIGKLQPVKAPINARGPNLTQVGFRIREPFFYRWCKNPAAIIPGQEMPSVSVPVKGVLKENIDYQLAAVWTILNEPGFTPQDAGPLRVVRRSGDVELKERAVIGLDVLKADGKTYIAPLVIGLPNRHNVLYDLETGSLRRWWIGDMMEQRTLGKSWYWQTDEPDLWQAGFDAPELTIVKDGKEILPQRMGQFFTELDSVEHRDDSGHLVTVHSWRFEIDGNPHVVRVGQTWRPLAGDDWSHGFRRTVAIHQAPFGYAARLRLLDSKAAAQGKFDEAQQTLTRGETSVRAKPLPGSEAHFAADGTITTQPVAKQGESLAVAIDYRSSFPAERVASDGPPRVPAPQAAALNVVPGLTARRLSLPAEIMPLAMDWQDSEFPAKGFPRLVVASLEGRVWSACDANGDGWLDAARPISEELASPYGVVAHRGEEESLYVDVITKDALYRLWDDERGARKMERLAGGWGHTDDYHDWAVGLLEDHGKYTIALPCQQDGRSAEAAKFRGQVLEIDANRNRQERLHDPLSGLTALSSGHRFPMGIAKNKAGDLFVTDNQGNYNPFNELNHVQPSKHFGFINALDKNKERPPLTPPAINIPHPWTRSVNGICFLETPARLAKKQLWGPFEGQLIGCEYDTRRLIRMSLQKVGDTYQGACYPFSVEKPKEGDGLLGPISCAISPNGELYIGSIRDSGWGGGPNIGEVVRIDPPKSGDALPSGIAEVTASDAGFTIRFTQAVDAQLAADAASYSVESYMRVSTPAYGGPDQDRRAEKITQVELAPDQRSVLLKFKELRPGGYVYEFHLKNLATGDREFFPAEAYYTLNVLP